MISDIFTSCLFSRQIRDLINPATTESLQVRGSIEDGFYVENLYSTYIETIEELLTILEEGRSGHMKYSSFTLTTRFR